MSKVTMPITNDYCPQTLFSYGTFKEDGTPNFGLFCWFSYYMADGLGVMAAIGGEKLTLERIRETKVFSANLITEKLLPLADHFGSTEGYSADKMDVPFAWERGQKLNVPVLSDSPVSYELEVVHSHAMPAHQPGAEGSTILLCRVVNILGDESLLSADEPLASKMARIAPVSATQGSYLSWKGDFLGGWGEPKEQLNR